MSLVLNTRPSVVGWNLGALRIPRKAQSKADSLNLLLALVLLSPPKVTPPTGSNNVKADPDLKKLKRVLKTKWTKPAVWGLHVYRAIDNAACVDVVFTQNVVEPLVSSLEVLLDGSLGQSNQICHKILGDQLFFSLQVRHETTNRGDDARTDILITIEYSNKRQLNRDLLWTKGAQFLSEVKIDLDNSEKIRPKTT
ncbi:hypothetical protein DL96DRAFT_1690590 [Flagelloscypha sp. PMI_526]|nr:hypothetical protein DL96DRAFT_1690590 [Flagelloscypha sp. PMI_526]